MELLLPRTTQVWLAAGGNNLPKEAQAQLYALLNRPNLVAAVTSGQFDLYS